MNTQLAAHNALQAGLLEELEGRQKSAAELRQALLVAAEAVRECAAAPGAPSWARGVQLLDELEGSGMAAVVSQLQAAHARLVE